MCDLLEKPHSMAVSNEYRGRFDQGHTNYFRTCPAPRIEARGKSHTSRAAKRPRTEQARETVQRIDDGLHTPIMLMTVVMRLMKRLTLAPHHEVVRRDYVTCCAR